MSAHVTPMSFGIDPKQSRISIARYNVQHSKIELRSRLDLTLQVERGLGRVWASMPDMKVELEGEDAETVEKAIDKLAEWMERTAEALRHRGPPRAALAEYEPHYFDSATPDAEDSTDNSTTTTGTGTGAET